MSVEKQLSGKVALEEHMKEAVQEANSELSRHLSIIVSRDEDLKEKSEYIDILEKRIDRSQSVYGEVVDDLKAKILEQDETIRSLEEKYLSQMKVNASEADAFRAEKFNISIKLQVTSISYGGLTVTVQFVKMLTFVGTRRRNI